MLSAIEQIKKMIANIHKFLSGMMRALQAAYDEKKSESDFLGSSPKSLTDTFQESIVDTLITFTKSLNDRFHAVLDHNLNPNLSDFGNLAQVIIENINRIDALMVNGEILKNIMHKENFIKSPHFSPVLIPWIEAMKPHTSFSIIDEAHANPQTLPGAAEDAAEDAAGETSLMKSLPDFIQSYLYNLYNIRNQLITSLAQADEAFYNHIKTQMTSLDGKNRDDLVRLYESTRRALPSEYQSLLFTRFYTVIFPLLPNATLCSAARDILNRLPEEQRQSYVYPLILVTILSAPSHDKAYQLAHQLSQEHPECFSFNQDQDQFHPQKDFLRMAPPCYQLQIQSSESNYKKKYEKKVLGFFLMLLLKCAVSKSECWAAYLDLFKGLAMAPSSYDPRVLILDLDKKPLQSAPPSGTSIGNIYAPSFNHIFRYFEPHSGFRSTSFTEENGGDGGGPAAPLRHRNSLHFFSRGGDEPSGSAAASKYAPPTPETEAARRRNPHRDRPARRSTSRCCTLL